mmetsp:Transcript_5074/g.5873  ORF Transcript_5074/g.5873 Transcript_5074/m.5873 type:complete len:110 (-) Transcript_5074:84-413(-)
MARSTKQADGIWFKPDHSMGFKVYSRTGTFTVTRPYMNRFPIDPELNVWYRTHMSPGLMPCAGKCSGGSPPRWWNVNDEYPPFINRELARTHCAGYCRMARKAEAKGRN